ncbi:MAG: multicopper oxidase domain-containing protein, partial [Bacteroidota bacterium]
MSDSIFNLNIKDSSRVFFSGFNTSTYGMNVDYLGPVLFLNKGDSVQFHVTNHLSDTTTLHWHGLHVAPQNDGGPHVTILPGATWSPAFTIRDEASTH